MDEVIKMAAIRDLALYAGMQIKLRRTQLRMSLAELSEQTGITTAALSRIERGETDMKLSTLAVIRTALSLNIDINADLGGSYKN